MNFLNILGFGYPNQSNEPEASRNLLFTIPQYFSWEKNGVTVAGGHGKGNALNQLTYPYGLYVDEDQTLYIADSRNSRIVEWNNSEGKQIKQLSHPTDVIVDQMTDSLIICDHGNRQVVKRSRRDNVTSEETIIKNVACWGLTMDNQRHIYVSDCEKHEVRRYRMGESTGIVVAGKNGKGADLNQLNHPTYIFVDKNQSVYVSDRENHRVMKWMKGEEQGVVVAGGRGAGKDLVQLNSPNGLFVDQFGTIYVADSNNHRVMRWSKGMTGGEVILGGNNEGIRVNQFDYPAGLSFDRHGNLYVVDHGNERVQRFSIELSMFKRNF